MKRLSSALPILLMGLIVLTYAACAPHPRPMKPDAPKIEPVQPVNPDIDDESTPRPDLPQETFAGAIQKQLEAKGRLSRDEKRILKILNSPDSKRRDRQIDRMESHSRVELGISQTEYFDWSADIDWQEVLMIILELLIRLLPLLFA